ncbi:hypothetical protein HK104_000373 [Borealophlyctis nickersoniae]|nr:hypothetical protein HK104_000373 [Borealophlyctis nickersoniae]
MQGELFGDQSLKAVEDACLRFYHPIKATDQAEAERILAFHFPTFSESTFSTISNASPTTPMTPAQSIMHCQLVLEHSASPYAQMFVLTHLKTLVSSHFSLFTVEEQLELRNFVLRYLTNRGNTLEPFIITSLAHLYCFITKLGWFEKGEFRDCVTEASKFLQASTVDFRYIGVKILGLLVAEMNQPTASLKNTARHRKTAVNFRDTLLLQIFQISLGLMGELLAPQEESKMQDATLALLRNCLTFDFIGTNPDESSEDVGSVQIPATWRSVITDTATLQLLFDSYRTFPSPYSSQVMECLSMVISTRRSLFSDDEKGKFLSWSLQATLEILRQDYGLDDERNRHEFCRLLARLKSVNQLSEMIEKPTYPEWIQLVAKFTIDTLTALDWQENSIIYLLTFWSKMAASVPSSGQARPAAHDILDTLAVQVTIAFFTARMTAVDSDDGDGDSPFGEEGPLLNVLELVASIARLKYSDTCAYVINFFDGLAQQFQASSRVSPAQMRRIVVKFAWVIITTSQYPFLTDSFSHVRYVHLQCIYLMGSMIGARAPYQTGEEQDLEDGDLTGRVLQGKRAPEVSLKHLPQLVEVNQNLVQQHGDLYISEDLERAFLHFLNAFRRSYFGDLPHRSQKLYSKLIDYGITDQNMILGIVIQKLGNNLRFSWRYDKVIFATVNLMKEIAVGYNSVKALRKTDTARFLLENHTSEFFPFLDFPANKASRAIYYHALAKLLLSDDNSEADFMQFIKPFSMRLDRLSQISDITAFQTDSTQAMLDGTFRDLRGFTSACLSKKHYTYVFDWFFPYIPAMLKGLEANWDKPVAIQILKFFREFVTNTSSRLLFDISSVNGILIFRQTSKVLTTYGQYVIPRVVDDTQKWTEKYKGYTVCLKADSSDILRNSLGGRYVNFGVFELYRDPALVDAVRIFFQMMLSIPLADLMVHPKLAKAFFGVLECFSSEQMLLMKDLNAEVFSYIMHACAEGVKAHDTVSTPTCATVENIATFILKQTMLNIQPQHELVLRAKEQLGLFTLLLSRFLEAAYLDDVPNLWSLTRPLLPLVLLNKEFYHAYIHSLIHAQLPLRQEAVAKALHKIMENVEYNMLGANKDRFTQNVMNFRRELSQQQIMMLIPPELKVDSGSAF